jgi:hypothetical protein
VILCAPAIRSRVRRSSGGYRYFENREVVLLQAAAIVSAKETLAALTMARQTWGQLEDVELRA